MPVQSDPSQNPADPDPQPPPEPCAEFKPAHQAAFEQYQRTRTGPASERDAWNAAIAWTLGVISR